MHNKYFLTSQALSQQGPPNTTFAMTTLF